MAKITKNNLKAQNIATSNLHSVVKFDENECKMFECIWDGWFVDQDRNRCYWPPSKGKSYVLRVLSKEKPDDTWKIYPCVVVSAGHATYKNGFDFVKQKCDQRYNTSSADEYQEAKKYRRKHPVLAGAEAESFEHIFSLDKAAEKRKTVVKEDKAKKRKILPDGKSISPSVTDFSQRRSGRSNHPQSSTVTMEQSPISIRNLTSKHLRRSPINAPQASVDSIRLSRSNSSSPIWNRRQLSTKSRIKSTLSGRSRSKSPANVRQASHRSPSNSCSSNSNQRRSSSKSQSKSPASTHSIRRPRSDCSSPISNRRRSSLKSRSRSPARVRQASRDSIRRSQSCSSSRRRSSSISRSRSPSSVRKGSDCRQSRSKRCSSTRSVATGQGNAHLNRQVRLSSKSQSRSCSNSSSRSNCGGRHSDEATESLERQVKQLKKIAKESLRRTTVNERRIARMEVSINKILVVITDLRKAINSESQKAGIVSDATITCEIPKGFKEPDFPLSTLPQLLTLKRNLEHAEFRAVLLSRESYYCSSTGQSDSAVMTAYLKRFVTLKLREDVHFKEPKVKNDDPILVRDFNEIYKFLIDVMIKGYALSKRQIKESEAHVALRTVWSRTKQMLRETRY